MEVVQLKTIKGEVLYFRLACACTSHKLVAYSDLPCDTLQEMERTQQYYGPILDDVLKSTQYSMQDDSLRLEKTLLYDILKKNPKDRKAAAKLRALLGNNQYFAETNDVMFLLGMKSDILAELILRHFLFVKITRSNLRSVMSGELGCVQYSLGRHSARRFAPGEVCSGSAGVHITTVDAVSKHMRYLGRQIGENRAALLVVRLDSISCCTWCLVSLKGAVNDFDVVDVRRFRFQNSFLCYPP